MRKVASITGMCLVLLAVWMLPAAAQDAKPFRDVPTTHWAYAAVTDLQRDGLLTGYPTGYFQGKRTLTRYEFAVALKRTLDKIPTGTVSESDFEAIGEAKIDTDTLAELKRLVYEFQDDLAALGSSKSEIAASLDKLGRYGARLKQRPPRQAGSSLFSQPEMTRRIGDIGNPDLPLVLHSPARTGFTGAAASLLDPLTGSTGIGMRLLYPTLTSNFAARFDPEASTSSPGIGLKLNMPLFRAGQVGMSLQDIPRAGAPGIAPGDAFEYATDLTLRPAAHLTVGAGAVHSANLPLGTQESRPLGGDNDIYRLNVGYTSRSTNAIVGYEFIDPRLDASSGGNLLLANLQGPYTRLSWQFSNSLRSYLGGDLYALSSGGPTGSLAGNLFTGTIYRGTAGIHWNPIRGLNLSADYEGVLYDLSGALSAYGRRMQPIEQYITLGAGLNLSRNAILKLAYQIVNQQDIGAGIGDPSFGQSGSTNSSVFTTQLAIHF